MMNKAVNLIASACAIVLVSTTSAAVWASATDVSSPWPSSVQAVPDEQPLPANEALQRAAAADADAEDARYAAYFRKASSAGQLAALRALQRDRSLGRGVWTRDALTIVGDLPKEGPRLSIADAARIVCEIKQPSAVRQAFDAIAGAPDWEGGDRVRRAVYFTGSDRKEAVCISNDTIVHIVSQEQRLQPLADSRKPAGSGAAAALAQAAAP